MYENWGSNFNLNVSFTCVLITLCLFKLDINSVQIILLNESFKLNYKSCSTYYGTTSFDGVGLGSSDMPKLAITSPLVPRDDQLSITLYFETTY